MFRANRVLDLNDIFLFIAIVSPLVVLGRTVRRAGTNRVWQLAAVAVLIVTAGAWLIARGSAGYVGGGAWLLLLFLPAVGLRRAADLAAEHRFGAAARLISVVSVFHPLRRLREQGKLFRAMAFAQRAERDPAERMLDQLARGGTRVSAQAAAQRLRIAGEWDELLAWCQRNVPGAGVGEDPSLLPLYFRALGELGRRDELVQQFAARAPTLVSSAGYQPFFVASLALLFAFCGRTPALVRLINSKRLRLPADSIEFWLATSEIAAGELGAGRARLERLRRSTSDALIRTDVEQRLARRGQLPPLPLSPVNEVAVARFERGLDHEQSRMTMIPRGSRATPAVITLIALNVAMFLVEVALGGSTNPLTLHSLGALEPTYVFAAGQYWRLVAALFLHFGALHLLFNCYALFVIGPALESWIGSARFAVAYLLAGIGSSAGVLLLWRLGLTRADLLVGASGSVMGIVGVWAGVLLVRRRAPLARQRLMNIAVIVALQTAFDLYTPQVSMAAHMSGLLSGFVLGLFITPKHEL